MLKVLHVYPELLNLYSDRGNIIAVKQRCSWRNIEVAVREVGLNDPLQLEDADILFLGGGAEHTRQIALQSLLQFSGKLKDAVENGIVILAVGSGYQILGNYYHDSRGERIEGLSILDYHTKTQGPRLIGDIVLEVDLGGQAVPIVGFENHSGKTYLGNTKPLGRVLAGHGNNGTDGWEGARYKNTFGTYLHGPLLPKNPELADYLILQALRRAGQNIKKLPPLDDAAEITARKFIMDRLGLSKK